MAEDTCAVDGCDRPRRKREWCQGHYDRWRRTNDAGSASFAAKQPGAVCAVGECDRLVQPHGGRGWCNAHYLRWRSNGDPGSAEIERKRKGEVCSVEGCTRRYYGNDYCSLHWQRWKKYGDPAANFAGHNWLGDDAGYEAVHARLKTRRGPARHHFCAHCGAAAKDWAYDGACPDEKTWLRHGALLTYSTDLDRYMPLCRECHSRFDENTPQSRTEPGSHNVGAIAIS